METKHTPGPWSVRGPTKYLNQIAIDPSIGCAYGAGDEIAANARLIASAPELLEALRQRLIVDSAYTKLALSDCDPDEHERRLQTIEDAEDAAKDAARAAIAKATGEQS